MGQNRGSYHNITIRGIRSSLIELSSCVDEMKMMYCPVHKHIYENEIANSLEELAAKKANYLPPRIDLSMSDLKNTNTLMTIDWQTPNLTNTKSLFQQYVKRIQNIGCFNYKKQLEEDYLKCSDQVMYFFLIGIHSMQG